MSLPVILRPEARADLVDARAWYEQQRPGLGNDFSDAVDEFLARIQVLPALYAVVLKGVRRGKLRRFPHVVYYRVLADRIEVVGVLHGGRDPGVWRARV